MPAKVLVVDDILPNVKLLEAKLKREYFTVITAMSGEEALRKVEEDQPDLILLDIMMPGMDGFEVCERLKSQPETMHIPIVMVTALSESADRVRGLEAGADDFLTKPVSDTALMSRVRSLVRLKMTIDEWRLRESTANQFGVLGDTPLVMREDTTSASILLIEDNAADSRRITETLQRDHHHVTVAQSGEEAIHLAETKNFELIILSLTMEREDGLRLCNHFRLADSTRNLPILMLADEEDSEKISRGVEFGGAHDYAVRPVDSNELLARVRTQIRRRRYRDRLRRNYEASLSMALTDPLTGLFNRRYLMAHLKQMISQIGEQERPLCLMILDIDHFKNVNDTYGHGVGDEVLKEFARRLNRDLRSFDLVTRLGGEEFVIALPNIRRDVAFAVSYRIKRIIADEPFSTSSPDTKITITTSIGGVILDTPIADPQDAIDRADACLYKAKDSGRNAIYFEDVGLISRSNVTPIQIGK